MRWSHAKANLNWYEYAWAILPLILAPVGGLVGGLCGGGAAALNIYLFGRKLRPATKFVVTGVISIAAVIAYMLFARVITITLFTEGQADRELQTLPSYVALKKADPDGYSKLLEQIVQLRSRSKPQAEVQAAAYSVLGAAVRRFQAHASDQALIDRVRITALEIDQIGAKSVDACADFLSPHPQASVNLQQYITPEIAKLDEVATAAILETGSTGEHPIPEKKQVEASLSQIRSGLVAQFGEDEVAKFGSVQITDHAKICKMNSAFLKLALSLPRQQAVSVLRFVLAQAPST
jgi:hypothetical protein